MLLLWLLEDLVVELLVHLVLLQLGPLQNLIVLLGDLNLKVVLAVGGQLEICLFLQPEDLQLVLTLLQAAQLVL